MKKFPTNIKKFDGVSFGGIALNILFFFVGQHTNPLWVHFWGDQNPSAVLDRTFRSHHCL